MVNLYIRRKSSLRISALPILHVAYSVLKVIPGLAARGTLTHRLLARVQEVSRWLMAGVNIADFSPGGKELAVGGYTYIGGNSNRR